MNILESQNTASVPEIHAVKGFEISPRIFQIKMGEVASCVCEPGLPLGLVLNAENDMCVLSGTPLSVVPLQRYEITVTHVNGNEETTAFLLRVVEAPIRTQRESIIRQHHQRADLDTPRSQVENALGDHAHMQSTIKPHEKFMHQPMGDDKRLSQQTQNNPEADQRAQQSPELTPSPSAKLQAQAKLAATPQITPRPGG